MAKKTVVEWLKRAADYLAAWVASFFWDPSDLPGCLVWLSAARSVYTTGSLVVAWLDVTGKHSVGAVNVVERPTFVPRCAALHGGPAIRFSGNEEILEKEGAITLPFAREPFSAFVVLSQASAGVDNGAAILWSGAGPHVGLGLTSSNVFLAYLEHSYLSDVTLLSGRPYLLGVVYDGMNATLYVNGAAAKTFTDVSMSQRNTGQEARFCIGGETATSSNFRGDVGEVVVYGRALTDAEIAKLSSELMKRYKISTGLRLGWFQKVKNSVRALVAPFG